MYEISEDKDKGLSVVFTEYGDEDAFDDFLSEKVFVPFVMGKSGEKKIFHFGLLASKEKLEDLLARFESDN